MFFEGVGGQLFTDFRGGPWNLTPRKARDEGIKIDVKYVDGMDFNRSEKTIKLGAPQKVLIS